MGWCESFGTTCPFRQSPTCHRIVVLYLIDTCILSYMEDPSSPFHEATLNALGGLRDADEVSLSILSLYELEYGITKAGRDLAPGIERAKRKALELYRILPLSQKGARIFAELKDGYRKTKKRQLSGKELDKHLARHTSDILIASTALDHAATVVSNDRIFIQLRRVSADLRIADWTKPG